MIIISKHKKEILILAVMGVIYGIIARPYFLHSFDELILLSYSMNASGPLQVITGMLAKNETNPVMIPLMYHFWIKLFGGHQFILHLPSLMAFFTSSFLVLRFLMKRYSNVWALLGIIIFMLSVTGIWIGPLLHNYSFYELFFIGFTLSLIENWNKKWTALFFFLLANVHFTGTVFCAIYLLQPKVIKKSWYYCLFLLPAGLQILYLFFVSKMGVDHASIFCEKLSLYNLIGISKLLLVPFDTTIFTIEDFILAVLLIISGFLYQQRFKNFRQVVVPLLLTLGIFILFSLLKTPIIKAHYFIGIRFLVLIGFIDILANRGLSLTVSYISLVIAFMMFTNRYSDNHAKINMNKVVQLLAQENKAGLPIVLENRETAVIKIYSRLRPDILNSQMMTVQFPKNWSRVWYLMAYFAKFDLEDVKILKKMRVDNFELILVENLRKD